VDTPELTRQKGNEMEKLKWGSDLQAAVRQGDLNLVIKKINDIVDVISPQELPEELPTEKPKKVVKKVVKKIVKVRKSKTKK